MTDEIQKMEDMQVPKGRIDLVGCGRLGLRIAINLMQVHRGGPKIIGAFDGQKIDGGDVIFTLHGAEIGQYKPDFIKQLCTHKEEFRNIISYPEYIDDENIDLIEGIGEIRAKIINQSLKRLQEQYILKSYNI